MDYHIQYTGLFIVKPVATKHLRNDIIVNKIDNIIGWHIYTYIYIYICIDIYIYVYIKENFSGHSKLADFPLSSKKNYDTTMKNKKGT